MMTIYSSYLVEVDQVLHCIDFIFQTFSISDFVSPTRKTITKHSYNQSVSERVLLSPGYSTNIICDLHKEWSEKLAARNVANM